MAKIALVVFTGPCRLEGGKTIVREALERASKAANILVAPRYHGGCHYVVASRTDTVKALKAKADGKLVLTYDQYVKHLADLGVDARDQKYAEGAAMNPIVDGASAKQIKKEVVLKLEDGTVVL